MTNRNLTAPTPLQNAFLSSYLLADVLFSRFCYPEEMRAIFDQYAKTFCLHNKDWLEQIWEVVSSDLFSLADNAGDFNRLVRLSKQFPDRLTDDELYVLTRKSVAIKTKTEILLGDDDAPFETVIRTLERRADGNDTDCMALYGFLQYHGLLIAQNTAQAETKLTNATLWNNLFATLIGSHHLLPTAFYHGKLCALVSGASNQSVREYLGELLGIPEDTAPDKIALALEHAFCQGTFQTAKVNPDLMKLMRSTVLSESHKHSLILAAANKENVTLGVPLEIRRSTEIVPDLDDLAESFAGRSAEAEQITANLAMIDLRGTSVYKPLLIVCEDEMVLEYYSHALRHSCAGTPVVSLDLQDKDKCNMAHSKENAFVAAMEKHGEKNVMMLFYHCDTLDADRSRELAWYLRASNRKHFRIPCTVDVEVDLSGTLPVLFASRVPAACIAQCCDVIIGTELSKEEFCRTLESALEKKRKQFKLSALSMAPDVSDFLFEYSSATVTNLLNKAIGQQRRTCAEVHITVRTLQDVIERYYTSKSKNGFWRNAT